MRGKKLDRNYVEQYWNKQETASKWEPEEIQGFYTEMDRAIFIQERIDVIKIVQPKDKIILDLGAGKGRFAIALAEQGAKLVIGVDISEEMLKIAKERTKQKNLQNRIIFERGDAQNLKYPNDYFDAAICLQTFMHLPNPQKCMQELARVVRPGGLIIVDQINKNHLWRIRVRGLKDFGVKILYDAYLSIFGLPFRWIRSRLFGAPLLPATTRRMSKDEFLNLFGQSKTKLKVIEFLKYGPNYCPVYWLICALKENQREKNLNQNRKG